MTGKRLQLYLRTVRHIKPRQLGCFVLRRVFPAATVADYGGEITMRRNVGMIAGIVRIGNVGAQNEFRFLGIAKSFDFGRMDWSCREMSKLWRYNLHYFDYVHDAQLPWETIANLMTSWVEYNPVGAEDAWEPFPVSLRVVNWIKYFFCPEMKRDIPETWLRSLYQQARWLEKNIEYHLLANHYFKNGKALIFAGLFFSGSDAERWLKKGLAIIGEELDEQILADGGHFERSPMYHAMILEDCLDLFNIMGGQNLPELPALRERLRHKAAAMLVFLDGMTHPDGDIALFNDAAIGIEARPSELADYYERLTGEKAPKLSGEYGSFAATGYHVMAPRPGDRLIIDCGPVGPEYQPGHAHCDTLSFELSLKGKRVIVDSGCCRYVDGDVRRYNRGNAGHNTVTIDGENQSEVWGAHRCARRAKPLFSRLEKQDNGALFFAGAHDGYWRLRGKPTHHRAITWSGETCLVEDRVEGKGSHDLESRLHIHPALSVEIADGSAMIRAGAEPLATVSVLGGGRLETTDGWYCPEFGVQQRCAVVTSRLNMASLPFSGGWVIMRCN